MAESMERWQEMLFTIMVLSSQNHHLVIGTDLFFKYSIFLENILYMANRHCQLISRNRSVIMYETGSHPLCLLPRRIVPFYYQRRKHVDYDVYVCVRVYIHIYIDIYVYIYSKPLIIILEMNIVHSWEDTNEKASLVYSTVWSLRTDTCGQIHVKIPPASKK